jgi:uncharacterized protein YecE (DUF72 family)
MGWYYKDWVGPFYPPGTLQKNFLQLYSLVFDTVEVDSSFYRTPSASMIKQWKDGTPDDFLFTVKFPREISYDGSLQVAADAVNEFEETVRGLGRKLASALILLPPSSKFEHMFDHLKGLLSTLSTDIRYAIEFRHSSWFRQDVYNVLENSNTCFAWSSNRYVETPPVVTGDFIYLRLIGDRTITTFDRVQKDRMSIMKDWVGKMQATSAEKNITGAYVFSNNHFAGFAPETVNTFRRLYGIDEKEWRRLMVEGGRGHGGRWKQMSLGDTHEQPG